MKSKINSEFTSERLLAEYEAGLEIQESLPETCSSRRQRPKVDFRRYDFEEFVLLRMIGEGSFAKVYLAKEKETGHQYAVKVLKKKWIGNLAAEEMFEAELESLGDLEHPSVVRVFGAGILPHENRFLVLELVVGKPITMGNGCSRQIEQWIDQLRNSIEKIHESGWTHGDVRISNILIDSYQQLKLLDFGFTTKNHSPDLKTKDWEAFDKVCLELRSAVPNTNG